MTDITTTNLAICDFKLEAKNIISELEKLYRAGSRQIDLTFSKLCDNLPTEIVDVPINECLEAYLNFVKSEDSYIKLLRDEKKTKEVKKPKEEQHPDGDAKKPTVKVKEVSIVEIIDDSVVAEDDVKGNKVLPNSKLIDSNDSRIDFEK